MDCKIRIIPPLEEEEPLPMDEFIIANVPPREANNRFKLLNKEFPLSEHPHIKRVRRVEASKDGHGGTPAKVQLQVVVLSVASLATLSQEKVVQLQKLDLLPTPAGAETDVVSSARSSGLLLSLPSKPPLTREHFDAVNSLWPVVFKPSIRRDAPLIDRTSVSLWERHMREAIEQADVAKRYGQLPEGVVVVDPKSDKVVARAFDLSQQRDASLLKFLATEDLPFGRDRSGSFFSYHPLHEACMNVVDAVAFSHRSQNCGFSREQRAQKRVHREESRSDSDECCGTEREKSEMMEAEKAEETTSLVAGEHKVGDNGLKGKENSEGEETKNEELLSRTQEEQYLCTGYDVYITHEPSTMSAMALLHSRVRRVIIGAERGFCQQRRKEQLQGNRSVTADVGQRGSNAAAVNIAAPFSGRTRLHANAGLNHHFDVIAGVLSDEIVARLL